MGADARLRPAYTDQDLLRALLRTDLYSFTQKVFETVVPGVAFSRNWSTQAVTHALEKVARSETTRLIINIPPRHLKSICASVALPAFLLGHRGRRKSGRRRSGRFEYPELVTQAVALWRKWKFEGNATHLVIEDKGSGSSLIQSLKSERIYSSPNKLKVEGDKVMRLTAQAAQFHAGSVHLVPPIAA